MGLSDDPTAPAADSDAADLPALAAADRYELIERLGEGAMGVVWEARDRTLDRTVALKVLHDRFLGQAHQEQLATEARAMARLTHPNVVRLYDVGERDGRTFLTMELIRGQTLKEWLATPRPWRDVVAAFLAAARGLAAAHDAGVIHRDVKPTNILRGDDGVVRVADFGVAHAGSSSPTAAMSAGNVTTMTTGIVGTPAYMSPERLRGEPADATGDQFAFCVALYEGLAGKRPFVAADADELAAAVARGAPPVPGIPRWLARVLTRGLAADPAARFASMNELVAALDRPRRRQRMGLVAGAVAIAGASVATLLVMRGDDAPACDVGRELDGVWDAAARERGATAFAGIGVEWAPATWTHLERGIDRYAAAWLAARERACKQPADALRVNRCLDDRRAALRGLVLALAKPDRALAERASRLVVGLPPIDDCERPTYVAGVAAGSSADVRQAHDDVAAARIARLTGREADAVPLADRAVTAARAAGDRWLEADALMVRGDAEMNSGAHAKAIDTLGASIDLAGAIGALDLQFDGRLRLSQALDMMRRYSQAHRVLDLAEQSLSEMPERPLRRGYLLIARARVLQREGKAVEAKDALERALAILTPADGVDTETLAVAHNNLANIHSHMARLDDALAHYRKASELRAGLGDDHPTNGKLHAMIANVLTDLGRTEESFTEYERALAILRRAPGKETERAEVENNYASALGYAGRSADAVTHFERAVEIGERLAPEALDTLVYKANLGAQLHEIGRSKEAEGQLRAAIAALADMPGAREDHLASFRQNLGVVLGDLGRGDEGRRELDLARAGFEKLLGPDHPAVAQVLVNLARNDLAAGRHRSVRELAERALAIRDKALPADHPDRGEALTFLAVGRLHTGDTAGAVAAAEQAVANLKAAGADPTEAEKILAQAQARRP